MQAESFRRLSANEGLTLVAAPASELDRYVHEEMARWRKVIEAAGIKAE